MACASSWWRVCADLPEHLEPAVREAVGEIETQIDNLSALIDDLRPAALDQMGLEAALESLLERVRSAQGLEIDAAIRLGAERLPSDVEGTVYRVVQEALTNVGKHARAQRSTVTVEENDGTLAISVTDDGLGFDARGRVGGRGLLGMRERLELVGGTLSVESSRGAGTALRACVPAARRPGGPRAPEQSRLPDAESVTKGGSLAHRRRRAEG